jgi:uncharacterized membrane protein YfcA
METLWTWLLAAATGAIGSLVDTTSGMGFGALSTTILVASGLVPATVIASVNIAKVGSGIAGGLSHWRMGNVRWRWVLPLALPGVAGGIIGALALTSVDPDVFRRVTPWLLVAMGVLVIRRSLSGRFDLPPRVAGASAIAAIGDAPAVSAATSHSGARTPEAGRVLTARVRKAWTGASLYVIGFVAGLLNSATGAYGPFATSALLLVRRGRPRFAIGTVTLVEVAVAAAVAGTLLARLGASPLGWQLPAALVAGALVTAPFGAWLSARVPARAMGIAVGTVMISMNAFILASS